VTTPLTEQENSWLNEVALRLRAIQTEADAASPERRRACLHEEIGRCFAHVPAENRKRLFQALLKRFPSGKQPGNGQPAATSVAVPVSDPKPSSPDELVATLLASAANLSPDHRTALARKLAEAGFGWVDREQVVLEISDDFRQALGLSADQQPRLARIVQLSLLLIDLLSRLDHMALKTLSDLAPRSALLTRPQEFREAMVSYLTGATDSIEPPIRAVSGLLGGLLAAMLGAGRDFGRQFVERFSPNSIEDVVKGEGKVKLFGNEKALCWDKYKDLARDYATAELVDRRIKDSLGTFAEKKALAAR
jgi:hypothetical protein